MHFSEVVDSVQIRAHFQKENKENALTNYDSTSISYNSTLVES